jgi:hypothetical protein
VCVCVGGGLYFKSLLGTKHSGPGGSTGPRYVLQLFLSQKSQKLLKSQQPLNLEKKIITVLESFDFLCVFDKIIKNNQILLNTISHRVILKTKLFTG